MSKPGPVGSELITVSWIPAKFAVLGKILELRKDNGWKVISVSDKEISEQKARNISHNSDDIWEATSGSSPRGNK